MTGLQSKGVNVIMQIASAAEYRSTKDETLSDQAIEQA